MQTRKGNEDDATPTKEQLVVLIDSARNKADIEHIETLLTRIGYSQKGLMHARLREKAAILRKGK